MDELAAGLNSVLDGTVAGRALSRFGREIFFPRGIVAQSAEATARAHRLNATIGLATEDGQPMVFPSVSALVPSLDRQALAGYAPTGGLQPLRESWARAMTAKNPSLDISHCSLPLVVPGLTNGIAQCADLFVNEGDTVVMPDMHWDNYDLIFGTRKQADVRQFPLFTEGHLNLAGLSECLRNLPAPKAVLILNFPNNPSGYTPTREESARLVGILRTAADAGTDLVVICDDAYFGLFYESDTSRESIFAPLSAAHERILAVKVDGSTKEDHSWGFRLGFVTFAGLALGPSQRDALVQKLMGAVRSSVSSSSMPGQSVLLKAFSAESYLSEKSAAFHKLEARYRLARAAVEAHPWGPGKPLEPMPFNSGYFMTFRCHGFDPEVLRRALLDKGIGTISLNGCFLRVAYAAVAPDRIASLYAEIQETAAALGTH